VIGVSAVLPGRFVDRCGPDVSLASPVTSDDVPSDPTSPWHIVVDSWS